jgi:4-aminobutyrate aminotransferase-like enzyme
MAGVVTKQSTLDSAGDFFHAHTMGQHPLGIIATQTNIEIIKEENLVNISKNNGEYMMKRFLEMLDEYICIVDCRGIGSLIGVEISSKNLAEKIAIECYRNGIYIIEMGYRGIGVLRVAPPLVSSETQLENALNVIEKTIQKAERAVL